MQVPKMPVYLKFGGYLYLFILLQVILNTIVYKPPTQVNEVHHAMDKFSERHKAEFWKERIFFERNVEIYVKSAL
jgi:hypothetical protein